MRRAVLVIVVLGGLGCHEASSGRGALCRTARDCPLGSICVQGVCRADDRLDQGTRDARPPDRDATIDAAVTVDAAPALDAAPDAAPALDAAPDAAADMTVDAAPPLVDMTVDAAPPPADMAVDAAPPPVDMTVDAAPPPVDMTVDAAPPPVDMAVDAAPPPVDMAPPPLDMAVTLDAAPRPDMRPPPVDAFVPPDTASPVDLFVPILDAAPDAQPDAAPDAQPDAAPDAAPPRLGYWAPCTAAAQCQSDLCVNDPAEPDGRCTLSCTQHRDCPGLDVCLLSEGGGVCFRNETGDRCRVAADCIDGVCLAPPDPVPWVSVQSQCANRCVDDSKCPAGYRCNLVQTDRGPERVCSPAVPRIDTCPDGFVEQCPDTCAQAAGPDPLFHTRCINLDGPGYCSCTCRDVLDCPDGFACADLSELGFPDMDPQRPGYCMPMAGYTCPVQALAGAPDQCLTLTCVPDGPDPDDAYCSAKCTDDDDCPTGYRCGLLEGERYCLRP